MQSEQLLHPLKNARLKLGYTQVMLADFTQVGKATIQRAERGETLRPDTIRQLCDYFSERYHRQVEPQELGLVYWDTDQPDQQEALAPSFETEQEEQTYEIEEDIIDRREVIKRLGTMGLALTTAPHFLLEATLPDRNVLASQQRKRAGHC